MEKYNCINIQFGDDDNGTIICYEEDNDNVYFMNKNCEFWTMPKEYQKEIKAFLIKYKMINNLINNLGDDRRELLREAENV